jgi:hypothetical protein
VADGSSKLRVDLRDDERFVGAVIVSLVRRTDQNSWRFEVNAVTVEIPDSTIDLELLLGLRRKIEAGLYGE